MDAWIGARYYDNVVDDEFVIIGIYERAILDDDGSVVDSRVVVELLYDEAGANPRVELSAFKGDLDIEMIEKPDGF